MHWELVLLAEGGMPPERVLRAPTLNGAKTLGLEDQTGNLEVGKLADTIVLDKNPLESIHNTNSARYTIIIVFDAPTIGLFKANPAVHQ